MRLLGSIDAPSRTIGSMENRPVLLTMKSQDFRIGGALEALSDTIVDGLYHREVYTFRVHPDEQRPVLTISSLCVGGIESGGGVVRGVWSVVCGLWCVTQNKVSRTEKN